MVRIEVTNTKCKLVGKRKHLLKIQRAFKVRNPNAYFLRLNGHVEPGWDGMINYVTDAFYFKVGLLPSVYKYITDVMGKKVKLSDRREDFGIIPKVPKKVGNKKPRPYQKRAIKSIIENTVGDMRFPMGVENAATNAGKTIIMAGLYLAYKRKIPALVLINDGDLFEQFKTEIPELVGEDAGFIRGKQQEWGNFTVAMVQTLSRNLGKFKKHLAGVGMILVDECDLGNSKSYKSILNICYNAKVRVGLSGSVYLSKLKKDLPKNQNIRSYFGDEVFKITNQEMKEKGFSSDVVISIFPGNENIGEKGDWKAEYDLGITYNEDRAKLAVDRVRFNAKLGRLPALVICQFHDHTHLMYKIFQKHLGKKYKIEYVHGKVKNRKEIFERFRNGEIDILISTFIVRRGKNFPLIRYILNAAGSDSHSTVLQILGRIMRIHPDKKHLKKYMEDFMDKGIYLARHARHRLLYYKKEGFKVKEKYKQ